MWDLGDIVEAERGEVPWHSPGRDFRHQDAYVRSEQPLERGAVEMVPVQVREIDIIGLQVLDELGWRFGKIPPASPVARTDQPRIGNDPHAVVVHAQAGVAEYRELHTRNPWCFTAAGGMAHLFPGIFYRQQRHSIFTHTYEHYNTRREGPIRAEDDRPPHRYPAKVLRRPEHDPENICKGSPSFVTTTYLDFGHF